MARRYLFRFSQTPSLVVPRYILQAQRPNLESKNGRIRRPPIRICEKRNRTLFLPSCFQKSTPPQKKGTARPSFVSTLLELPKLSSSPFDASFDSTTTTDDEVSSSDHDSSFSSDDTEVAKDIITDNHDHDIRWTANSMYSGTSVPSPTSRIHVHVTLTFATLGYHAEKPASTQPSQLSPISSSPWFSTPMYSDAPKQSSMMSFDQREMD